MNYLALDLEMCGVSDIYRSRYKYKHEIIQIGGVLLGENYEPIATICQYVHPEYGVLDNFISKMTGIHNDQIKHAPVIQEALQRLLDWIGDREYQAFAWSNTDYQQLKHEIRSKKIAAPQIDEFMNPDRWTDYQRTFDLRYGFNRNVGLADALDLCEIEPDGHFHDGLDDAINTAKIIKKLEENSEYQIIHSDHVLGSESEPLHTSLGELFAGMNITFA